MHLAGFRHKGLRQLYADDNPKGLPAAPGNLRGFWSLTVTGNWRLIFRYDETTNAASDIDLTDYR